LLFKIDMPPLTMEVWTSEKEIDAHGGWTTNRVSIPSISFKQHISLYSMQDWFQNQFGKRKFMINHLFQSNDMDYGLFMRINHVQLNKVKIIVVIIEYKDGALSLITSNEAKLYQCSWNIFYTLQTT
jgi:hypothetical protein